METLTIEEGPATAVAESQIGLAAAGRWWGDFDIPEGRMGRWGIGSLALWVEHRREDWRLAYLECPGEPPSEGAAVECSVEPEEPPAEATVERVVGEPSDDRLRLLPVLADRSIVARPETPLRLLPGAEASLFVSIPIWIRLELAGSSQVLLDVPARRPSDTWFGPSTRQGVLCYAVRTKARLNLENLTVLPDRAIARVCLRNLAASEILLERLNLPVDELALYADSSGNLWTQQLTVQRTEGAGEVVVDFDQQPPPEAAGAERVADARTPARRGLLRALSGLLG